MTRARLLALALFCAVMPALAEPAAAPEILHMPVLERKAEQGILTPVPIELDLPQSLALRARRVLVHYRVWGDPDWIALELRRDGTRWKGAIPCLEVSTITGDVRYYIRVHDADGVVFASAGSRVKPYRVTIKHDTTLAPSTSRRARCPDPSDCPRGLPGCPSEKVKRVPCKSDRDCEGSMTCSWEGFCEVSARRDNWLSLGVEQDFGFVPTSGMCTVDAQENEGNACFRETDGKNYIGNPVATNEPIRAGLAPTRLVVGYERLVFYQSTIGLRAGWAFRGEGPTLRGAADFVPWSFALRASHYFGTDPFAKPGFRPFVFLTGGYAQFDIHTKADVREDPTKSPLQGENDLEQTLDAWKRAGDGFAGGGLGAAYAPTPASMFGLDVGVLQVFPFRATVVAITASAAVGL